MWVSQYKPPTRGETKVTGDKVNALENYKRSFFV